MSLSNIMDYKSYLAELMLDTEDNIIIGRVINAAETISFHGLTIEEAKFAFYDVIDTYLSVCKEENIEPTLPITI